MIDIHAPITIHQFDEQRYARMEVALATLQADVQAMRAQLQEVLTSRQAEVDAATAQLKQHNDALQLVIDTIRAQQPKVKG